LPGPLVTRLGALGTALNTGVKPELDRSIRTLIEERVAADSARLARLIGRDLPWTRTPRQAPS
jgi:hypothetical protein